jgi:hypothetical protein
VIFVKLMLSIPSENLSRDSNRLHALAARAFMGYENKAVNISFAHLWSSSNNQNAGAIILGPSYLRVGFI